MALPVDATKPIIKGNDHILTLQGVIDKNGALIDMSAANGWVIVTFFLKRKASDDDSLLELPATRTGVFNASSLLNTQAWVAALPAEMSEDLPAGTWYYAWKRMDEDLEADLSYGKQTVIDTASELAA